MRLGMLRCAEMEKGTMINGKPAPYLDSGRVILGVPDISMVDFFSQQVSSCRPRWKGTPDRWRNSSLLSGMGCPRMALRVVH